MDSYPRARSAPSGAKAAAVHPLRRPRGVRRRRDDNAAAVEIEELDSDVMRQNNAYNYFQLHGARDEPATGNPNEAGSGANATNSSQRKRQRTLAEQLEELCLNGAPRSSKMSGAAAAAACRQAWNRVFAAQMAAAQQRAAAQKAAAAAAVATPVQPASPATSAAPRAATANSADVDMDGNHSAGSSAAEDGDFDDAEEDEDSGRDSQSFKVFGGVPDVKGMFFGSNGGRQRPMERMFRHYVTMAAERSTRGDGNSTPRGDELVLFQQGPTSLEFPYSLFTPEQVEDLRARHNRKKKRFARSSMNASSSSSSSDNSWRFQELDSSDEADVSSSAEDSDMDMSGDGEAKAPQLAGALSHGEWFVDDEDENDLDSDSTL